MDSREQRKYTWKTNDMHEQVLNSYIQNQHVAESMSLKQNRGVQIRFRGQGYD